MKIGIIAGNGQFPLLFSKAARAKGYDVHVAAIRQEADEILEHIAHSIKWLHLGQVKKLLSFFREHGVRDVVMVGGIRKTRIFSDIKPDMKAVMLLASMKHTHDDGVLGIFADFLEKEGLRVCSSTFLLPELLAEAGVWTRMKPGKAHMTDIRAGFSLAKEIGRLDIGQCIVMGGGSVLAVEAIDGTDATIRRGAMLGKGDAVVIKVSKPNQDMRFDVPAVGLKTLETMHDSGATVLVIEAGKAIVFDKEEMVAYADQHNIAILALGE
ncbi:MAG: UDP-2,3-diacylglucosamine diphosphatase LpxI [Proteobacteria bacterium]|nr:UDP-2,3-diacylglucosamine diphosphatase LpxI [Pseudomonadota bacterium]